MIARRDAKPCRIPLHLRAIAAFLPHDKHGLG